jgi:hypothetical protein
MRALNAKIELSNAVRVFAHERNRGNAAGFEVDRLRETGRSARRYENRGNEAKEYLKTKDITFLNAANCARFARKSAQIGR